MADELKIDPEFEAAIPRPAESELAGLEEQLKAYGCRDALVGWQETGILLDGHNRKRICEANGIGFQVKWLSFPDRENALLWQIRHQNGRRNLTDDQRAVQAHREHELLTVIAKRERGQKGREVAGKRSPAEASPDRLSDAPSDKRSGGKKGKGSKPKRDTRSEAARGQRVSERKVRTVAEIAKVHPELVDAIARGEKTVIQAKKEAGLSATKPKAAKPEKTPEPKTAHPVPEPKPEPPAAPPTTDEEGTPLPDNQAVRDAFAGREKLAKVYTLHRQLMAALGDVWPTSAAARLTHFRQRIEATYREVHSLIRQYQPHAVCDECRGSGKERGDAKCGRCAGLGWITKEAFDRRSKADEARKGVA